MKIFYLPLSDFKIDTQRLLSEFEEFVKPDYSQTICYSLTTREEFVSDPNYNFRKFYGKLYPPSPGLKLLTGDYDYELVHWHTRLENSYMREIADLCSQVLGLKNPRVRCSVVNGTSEQNSIGMHVDQHAPARIHFALQTTKDCYWQFLQDDKIVKIFQPVDGTPVYIDTGSTFHDIYVPNGARRIHFWFQYHDVVDEDRLNMLKEKSKDIKTIYLE